MEYHECLHFEENDVYWPGQLKENTESIYFLLRLLVSQVGRYQICCLKIKNKKGHLLKNIYLLNIMFTVIRNKCWILNKMH